MQNNEDCNITSAAQQVRRLNSAKRRIKIFNKVALCLALIIMGRNIFNLLTTKRRRGGGIILSFFGEAFQQPKVGNSPHVIPKDTLQAFGSYPNVLGITPEMRRQFHPIMIIPLRKGKKQGGAKVGEEDACVESELQQRRSFWPWKKQKRRSINNGDSSCNALQLKMNETYDYIIKDYTGNNKNDKTVLLEGGKRVPQLLPTREEAIEYAKISKKSRGFDVGRYDEDRRGMYTSSLFLEEGSNAEANRRTIHIGVDIGAPVETPVYAFEDGVVHSAGYNADVGDYGHVIVIEHHLKNSDDESTKVYALYGHLAAKGLQDIRPGQEIIKGQVIGYLGDTSENGGWTGECPALVVSPLVHWVDSLSCFFILLGAHVHFQLAVNPPPTHDMPGVVALGQRDDALLEYPDPRYVLGELY